ncbi:hypothetical protein [Pseudomonas caspiana]|nr:hypothetical protein [Pseudomonas caspiana]
MNGTPFLNSADREAKFCGFNAAEKEVLPMFNLSSLVNALTPWRCPDNTPLGDGQASATSAISVTHSPSSSFSSHDMQACDAYLDDFLESMPKELTLIDLACYTHAPSSMVT